MVTYYLIKLDTEKRLYMAKMRKEKKIQPSDKSPNIQDKAKLLESMMFKQKEVISKQANTTNTDDNITSITLGKPVIFKNKPKRGLLNF